MNKYLNLKIPLKIVVDEDIVEVDEDVVAYTIDSLTNLVVKNNYLVTEEKMYSTTDKEIYCNGYICANYQDNVSIQSIRIPTNENFRYVLRQNQGFVFKKENPKPFIIIDKRLLDNITIRNELPNFSVFLKPFITANNKYAYYLPYGGIDHLDFKLFKRKLGVNTYIEDFDLDVIEGIVYINEPIDDSSVVFSIFNIKPLQINNHSPLKIKENVSGTYRVKNIGNNQITVVEKLSVNTLVVTFLKDCIIKTGDPLYKIDGVLYEKDQYLFVSSNDSLFIELTNDTETYNEEYVSLNRLLFENFAEHDRDPLIDLKNTENLNSRYFLKVFEKEIKNTYLLNAPILIPLF